MHGVKTWRVLLTDLKLINKSILEEFGVANNVDYRIRRFIESVIQIFPDMKK